ncbi:sugar transferase [bacterium]|nr:sugar transferase [bacterium]RQV93735.1 MAG: sugar transferase [bacterium]
MSKTIEKSILFLTDFITIAGTYLLWCNLRWSMGFFYEAAPIRILPLSFILYLFWLVLFLFFGLYRFKYTQSRTDEFIAVLKTVSIGIFIILLITFNQRINSNHSITASRLMIILYWGMMVVFVGAARVLLRSLHRYLLVVGIGRRKTLIVGYGKKAKELFSQIKDAPAMGYHVVGFFSMNEKNHHKSYQRIPVHHKPANLRKLIREETIQEVIVALSHRSERHLEEVIQQCNGTSVGIQIVPDLYDVIIGQVRTNQIYGLPLIEILPQLMPPWERIVKRIGDVIFSLFILLCFLPFWLLIALLIRLDTQGPIFYTQKRVGKGGKIFNMIKFRSMVVGAEKMTGPIWATNNDSRITKVGKYLRRLRLDEIPQFINILKGDMSLVGPRPERPYFVDKLSKAIPLYKRRLRVRPGITGWAQVKGNYDQSLECVKKKLEFDLFYFENMSLRMDLKIILNTLYVMLTGKGR